MSFQSFNLNKDLVASLDAAGYDNPTPLQKSLIPLVHDRKNVIVESQTAAGKTGGYLIPLASYLLNNPIESYRGSRILILTSRRERVNQINYTLKKIIKGFNLRLGFISGGRPYQHQMRLLKRPLDFLIATPSRLDDLVKNNKTDFSNIEALIIDDFSIIKKQELDILCKTIYGQVKGECPVIVFKDKNDDSKDFLESFIKNPEVIEIEAEKHPLISIPQEVYITDDHTHKVALMDLMLDELEDKSSLIFVSGNKAASSLQESLSNHGHSSEVAQQNNGDRISSDVQPILIVSDQLNVNIDASSYVNIFHFDLPRQVSAFQSRIINRGWENLERPAAILVDPHNRTILKKIEAQAGEPLNQNQVPGLEPMNTYISTPLLSLGGKKQSNRSKQPYKNRNNSNTKGRQQSSRNNNKQKQHKGQYGRLSGGVHRKNNRPKARINNGRGNANPRVNRNQQGQGSSPMFSTSADDNFANEVRALQEQEAKQNKVVIRYRDRKTRRLMSSVSLDDSQDGDSSS